MHWRDGGGLAWGVVGLDWRGCMLDVEVGGRVWDKVLGASGLL